MQSDEYFKLAEVEDRMWYFRSLHGHVQRELARAGAGAGTRLLDAGCGTGGLLLRLRAAWPQARFTGVDVMPLAADLARQRCGPDVEVRLGDIHALPFATSSFDAVVSCDVISEAGDAPRGLAEFFRVLRPGGVLVINLPAYMWLWSYHDEAVHTKHRYTRAELAGLLTRAGFRLRRLTHWNALPLPLVWARRKLFHADRETSDVKLQPWPVEQALSGAMAIEHAWLDLGGNWPWGVSVFGVAEKP